jgi:hypothetical protein
MPLTSAQIQTLKAAIAAETDAAFVINRTAGATAAMAEFFNTAHPSTKAWNKNAQWRPVFTAIDFTKYTPSVTATNAATDATATKQLLLNLVKLNVQQNLLIAYDGYFDARDGANVDGLLDSVTSVYTLSGTGTTSPGGASGVNVAQQLIRAATRGEAVFGGTDVVKATLSAKVLAWEGPITNEDVVIAFNS